MIDPCLLSAFGPSAPWSFRLEASQMLLGRFSNLKITDVLYTEFHSWLITCHRAVSSRWDIMWVTAAGTRSQPKITKDRMKHEKLCLSANLKLTELTSRCSIIIADAVLFLTFQASWNSSTTSSRTSSSMRN